MATHFNILAWRIPWTKESGQTVRGVAMSRTQLSDLAAAAEIGRGEEEQQYPRRITTSQTPPLCLEFTSRSGKQTVLESSAL